MNDDRRQSDTAYEEYEAMQHELDASYKELNVLEHDLLKLQEDSTHLKYKIDELKEGIKMYEAKLGIGDTKVDYRWDNWRYCNE